MLPPEIWFYITEFLDLASKTVARHTFFKDMIPEEIDLITQSCISEHSLKFLFFFGSIRPLKQENIRMGKRQRDEISKGITDDCI